MLKIRGKVVFFNKKAIQWLRVWLDSHFNFASYINKRMNKAQVMEFQIKQLNKTYDLCSGLVQRIQIVAV